MAALADSEASDNAHLLLFFQVYRPAITHTHLFLFPMRCPWQVRALLCGNSDAQAYGRRARFAERLGETIKIQEGVACMGPSDVGSAILEPTWLV